MAWRFVEQPNGRLARFSDIVDAFTHFDLSRLSAGQLASDVYGLAACAAGQKIAAALKAGEERWNESLEIIASIHGRRSAAYRRALRHGRAG